MTYFWENPVLGVNPRCLTGMTVQTLLLPSDSFNEVEAKRWAQGHGYKYGKVHTTNFYHRIRQREPDDFVSGSFRTVAFGDGGIKAVVGCPR